MRAKVNLILFPTPLEPAADTSPRHTPHSLWTTGLLSDHWVPRPWVYLTPSHTGVAHSVKTGFTIKPTLWDDSPIIAGSLCLPLAGNIGIICLKKLTDFWGQDAPNWKIIQCLIREYFPFGLRPSRSALRASHRSHREAQCPSKLFGTSGHLQDSQLMVQGAKCKVSSHP